MFKQQISRRELIGITVLFLLYFIILLGNRVLNVPDEGRYPDVARAMLLTGDFITPKLNGVAFFHKPILYYWLQSASYALFGISEWSTRLMPALIAVLGCVMIYVAGTLLYSRRAGILAAVILATNPLYYLGSHYADMNLEVAVFISATLFSFIVALQYPLGVQRRRWMWLAYAFAALGVLTKGLIGIVLPMMVMGVWIAVTWQWRLLREIYLGSGLLIFLAIALPWYVAVQIKNPGFFNFFIIYQHFTRFTGSGFNNPLPGWFYLPVLFLGVFPWSVPFLFAITSGLKRIWQKSVGSSIDLFLLLWVVLIIVFFSRPESKIVGYIVPVIPAMALLAGGYLARVSERVQRSSALLSVALAALLMGTLMLLFVDKLPQEQIAMGIKPYCQAMAVVLLIGGIVTALLAWWQRIMAALVAVAATGSIFTFALLLLLAPVSASESIKPLALLLKEVAVRPLHARVATANRASLRVLEKCGFVVQCVEVSTASERFLECKEAFLILK